MYFLGVYMPPVKSKVNKVVALSVRVQQRRLRVAKLYLEGKSQLEIADIVGIGQPAVSDDLGIIRKMWAAKSVEAIDKKKAEESAKIDNMELEAIMAWKRSCEDAESKTNKVEWARRVKKEELDKHGNPLPQKAKPKPKPLDVLFDDDLVPVKKTQEVSRKGQTGDPRFLELIARCIEMRIKLWGLAAEQKDVGTKVFINWGDMIAPSEDAPPAVLADQVDRVEEAIAEVEAKALVVHALPETSTNGVSTNGTGHSEGH